MKRQTENKLIGCLYSNNNAYKLSNYMVYVIENEWVYLILIGYGCEIIQPNGMKCMD